MLIKFYNPYDNRYEVKELRREQVKELFKNYAWLEDIQVLKISRVINRKKALK